MDEKHPIESVLSNTMDSLKKMIDVDTVIGNPITTPDGTTIIPVSKVSFGFASGGSDFGNNPAKNNFGGGSGGGVKICPVAFLVVCGKEVKMLPVSPNPDIYDKIFGFVPDIINKISEMFNNKEENTKIVAE